MVAREVARVVHYLGPSDSPRPAKEDPMSDTTYMVKVTYESERSLRGKRTGAHKVVEFLAASEREAHMIAALIGPRKYAPITFIFNGVSEDWEAFQLSRLGSGA